MADKDNLFGERLKSLRSMRGNKSQKEFAEELGIPQPTLSSYESGKIKPTVDAIINIADKCGISMDWLCGRDETFRLGSLGDVLSFFLEIFETEEFSIKTTVHNRVDIERKDATDDNDRNWVDLKVYYNETFNNPKAILNQDLCDVIEKAYMLTNELRGFERSQESYEREKQYYIDSWRDIPITKVDHSGIPIEEQRKRMLELMKAEWEALEKTDK